MAYQLFTFFQRHQEIIGLLYRAGKQYLLIDQLLASYDYGREDSNAVAYSKVTVAYFIFGWCDEWYENPRNENTLTLCNFQLFKNGF